MRTEDISVFEQFAAAEPDLTESSLDQHYTMAALNDIANVVRRNLRLAQLRASTTLLCPIFCTSEIVSVAQRAG